MDAVTQGAIITGAIGLFFLAVRWLVMRAIAQWDREIVALKAEVTQGKKDIAYLTGAVRELEGTLNSAWGLVSVVKKLDGNVEKLTSALDHMGATVETLMRVTDARSKT